MLQIRGLTKHFGGIIALEEVDVEVRNGQITGLIGPNGAGKTTLFNCLTGVIRPDRGAMWFGEDGRESLMGLAPHEIVACGIARTFQNIRLFANMTALENVMVGAYTRTHAGLISALVATSEARHEERWAEDRARSLLDSLGLGSYVHERAASLPFGLQRRLELARALASEPQLLLLDEPASGLNPTEKQELSRLIQQLRRQGFTILLIEHDMGIVMPLSDRVVVLDHGQKIADGPPDVIQRDPRVIEAYLGLPASEGLEGQAGTPGDHG